MSRVVRFHRTGGPEVLQIDDLELRPLAEGEVRIAVKALGLNRAESMFRYGRYLDVPQLPARVGYEAAGVVEAIGAGVTGFQVGDAVSSIPSFSQNLYGVCADAAIVPARSLAKFPASLSWEEAASIWMQYLTAGGALIDIAHLKAGDVVLVPAASSSVGLAAIQWARLVGATPIALTRGAAKKERLLELGAAHVVVTEEQDLVAEVMRITEGQGARVVFDPVGGPYVATLAAATAMHGIIFQYGALSKEPTPFPAHQVIGRWLTMRGYALFEIAMNPVRMTPLVELIVAGLTSRKLKPVISKTFAFEDIVAAYRYLESNQQVGKVVVTV